MQRRHGPKVVVGLEPSLHGERFGVGVLLAEVGVVAQHVLLGPPPHVSETRNMLIQVKFISVEYYDQRPYRD